MMGGGGGADHPAGREMGPEVVGGRTVELSRDHLWPLAIVLGLAAVVLVNLLFIYVAVSEADPVVPSYVSEHR
ncbi:MAG: hypothetical protein HKN73_18500 [Gemmatimonadetes bacterium]|nr:hypothetical protein [Gemmatimonadota bacterium]